MASGEFILTCKSLTGQVFKIPADGGLTVAELKSLIGKEAECSDNKIRVMKGRTFLKDDAKTLTDYKIETDMLLKIVIRLNQVVPKEAKVECSGRGRSVCLSYDDSWTALGTYEGHLYIIKTTTGQVVVCQRKAHNGAIRRIQFNRNGSRIVTGGSDNKVQLWQFNGKEVTEIRKFILDEVVARPVWGLCLSQDEQYIALCGNHYNKVKVYDVESGELYATFEHEANCRDVVFTRDAGILCGSTRGSHLRIWDMESKTELHHIPSAHSGANICNIEISKDDASLFSQGINTSICMWSIASGERLKIWSVINSYCFKLIKDDKFITYVTTGRKLMLFSVDGDENAKHEEIMDCPDPDQLAQSKYQHAFVVSTDTDCVNYSIIPEEKFFGML